jgi:hypothetical protein
MDSNGKGGYWVEVHWDTLMPANIVRAFGQYMSRDFADFGLDEPEVFPKQTQVRDGHFGNMVRLPGKHQKRGCYTKVWNGRAWLEGEQAVLYMLASPRARARGDFPCDTLASSSCSPANS